MNTDSQKRIYGNYIYAITGDVEPYSSTFRNEILCDAWIRELAITKDILQFRLFAFGLDYDHLHLLLKPDNKITNYSKIMRYFKRHLPRNANIVLGYDVLPESDNVHCRHTSSDVKDRRLRTENGNRGIFDVGH